MLRASNRTYIMSFFAELFPKHSAEFILSCHGPLGRHRQMKMGTLCLVVRQAHHERTSSNPFVLSLSKDGGYFQSSAAEGLKMTFAGIAGIVRRS